MNVMHMLGLFIFFSMVALILAHKKKGWMNVNNKKSNTNKYITNPQYSALPGNIYNHTKTIPKQKVSSRKNR